MPPHDRRMATLALDRPLTASVWCLRSADAMGHSAAAEAMEVLRARLVARGDCLVSRFQECARCHSWQMHVITEVRRRRWRGFCCTGPADGTAWITVLLIGTCMGCGGCAPAQP